MSRPPKNVKLAEVFDAKNTLMTIYQRNKSGLTSNNQSLNDLFTIEYIGKKMNASCKADVSRLRKCTQDYMNGRLGLKSYEIVVKNFAKKYGFSFPQNAEVKKSVRIRNIFDNKSSISFNPNKPRVNLNSVFTSSRQNKNNLYSSGLSKTFGLKNSISKKSRINTINSILSSKKRPFKRKSLNSSSKSLHSIFRRL